MKKKIIVSICVIGLMLVSSGVSVNALRIGNKQVFDMAADNSVPQNLNDCEIWNITVQEAWDLLNDTGNGIQYPIDVRRDYEWYAGFIDTPYPENPHWYCLDLLKNETGLQIFLDTYDGDEVIMYCKGGYRSLVASYILCEANFTGKIYNMLGGITAWMAAGLPIRNNTPPADPTIDGPTNGKVGVKYDYNFSTTDAEGDVVYYWILWGDGCPAIEWIGPYESGEVVTLDHTYTTQGTFNISAKAKDFYGNESDWTKLTVTMPKNKALNLNLFERLFERYQLPLTR